MDYLKTHGYVVIDDVLSTEEVHHATQLFRVWKEKNSIPVGNHGIIQTHNAGHQEHAWYIRTRPNVINIFQHIWNTKDLIVSFDGMCYMSPTDHYEDYWMHTDQSPTDTSFRCYQGFVALTDNEHKTMKVCDNTHLIYDAYVQQYNLKSTSNFNIIHEEYCKPLVQTSLSVKKGSLVIWDSRLFHQNHCGDIGNTEERIVQYVSYMPKEHKDNTEDNQHKRKNAFLKGITSTHWCAPLKHATNDAVHLPLFDIQRYGTSIHALI